MAVIEMIFGILWLEIRMQNLTFVDKLNSNGKTQSMWKMDDVLCIKSILCFVVTFTSMRSKIHSTDFWLQLIVSVENKQILFVLKPQQQQKQQYVFMSVIVSNSNVPMHEINQK